PYGLHRHIIRRGRSEMKFVSRMLSTDKELADTLSFFEKNPKIVRKLFPKLSSFIQNINYYSASQFTNPAECPASIEIENNELRRTYREIGIEHIKFMFDLYTLFKSDRKGFK